MSPIWDFVTDFGDSAVTIPLALLVLVFLLFAGRTRIALGWAAAIGGCAATIGVLKLVFGACGPAIGTPDIASPSGHTAISTVVYGALTLLIATRLSNPQRYIVSAATAVGIVGIGLSRLVLHDHTLPEIAIGLLVGAAALAPFRVWLGHAAVPPLPLKWLLLFGAMVIAVMHGTRWMIEPTVHRLAWEFRLALPWCR